MVSSNSSGEHTEQNSADAATRNGLVSRIERLRDRQAVLDERYKTLVAQLGAELYVRTRRDAAFRLPHEDLYAEIEMIAIKCKQGRDRLSELESRARALGLSFDRECRESDSAEGEEVHAQSTGRHAASSGATSRREPLEAVKDAVSGASLACPRCGAEPEPGDAFCGTCGAALGVPGRSPRHSSIPMQQVRSSRERMLPSAVSHSRGSAPDPAERIDLKPPKGVVSNKVAGAFDIIAILLTFMPWVGLNLYVWSGSYSLPGLIQLVFKANNTAANYLGSSYTGSDVGGTIFVTVILVTAVWLSVVIALGGDAYACLSSSRKGHSLGPLIGFTCMAGTVIVICFVVDMALASELSKASLSVSGIVSATSGAWISLIVGIAFLAYLRSKSK